MLAVLTAADAAADGLKPLRPYAEANIQTGEPFAFAPQPLLAHDKVRFAGEPVALIVAESAAQAADAAELVEIDYEPLPAVTSGDAARAAGAPLIADEVPGNVCLDWRTGDAKAADAAFARAAHVVSLTLDNHRIVMNPMEPRGGVGQFDPASGRYTLHVSSQNIHINRDHVARALGVGPADVRFVAPDVGGGFGAKNFAYVEHALVLWAARRTGRPVKWIASRSEVFLTDHAARDTAAEAALALDAAGRFLALKVTSVANLGAYMIGAGGAVQTYQYIHLQGTVYRIPAIALHIVAVLSNTAPIGVTRGPGFAETVNILERLIDAARDQGGLRSRRAAAPQHGAGRRHADDQRLRLPGRQRHLRRDAGRGPDTRRSRGLRRRAAGKARRPAGCVAWVLPITSRARAARRRRMSMCASSATGRYR